MKLGIGPMSGTRRIMHVETGVQYMELQFARVLLSLIWHMGDVHPGHRKSHMTKHGGKVYCSFLRHWNI
jgi:hypothetical protein